MVAFFCIDGGFIGFGSCLGTIFGETTLGTGMTSLVCGITVLFGIMSSFISGAIIQRRKNFRDMMRLSCFGCLTLFLLAIGEFFRQTDATLISINTIAIGCFIVPIIPISINFSSELTFPIEATVVTGTLMMVGQLGGFILALLIGFVCDAGSKGGAWTWVLFSVLGGIGSFCSVIVEEDLRKTNFSAVKVVHIATDRNEEVHVFDKPLIDLD